MKSLTDIVGILLVLLGIISFGYQSITYNKPEEVIKFGDVRVTATQEKQIKIPPIFGGACILAGVALVAVGRLGKK